MYYYTTINSYESGDNARESVLRIATAQQLTPFQRLALLSGVCACPLAFGQNNQSSGGERPQFSCCTCEDEIYSCLCLPLESSAKQEGPNQPHGHIKLSHLKLQMPCRNRPVPCTTETNRSLARTCVNVCVCVRDALH